MDFWIQVGNPKVSPLADIATDSSLGELIQAIFPMETEDALMVWNGIYVPLSYKYDVSVLIDDLVGLCTFLLGPIGERKRVSFGSDTFQAIWHVQRDAEALVINSEWQSVVGGTENLLNEHNVLKAPVRDFLAEWKELFEKISDSLLVAGAPLRESQEIQRLLSLHGKIAGRGRLYHR